MGFHAKNREQAIGTSGSSFDKYVFLIIVHPAMGREKKKESWSEERNKSDEVHKGEMKS